MKDQEYDALITELLETWMEWDKTLERFIEYAETPIPEVFERAFEED